MSIPIAEAHTSPADALTASQSQSNPIPPTATGNAFLQIKDIPRVIICCILCAVVSQIGSRYLLSIARDIPYAFGFTREYILYEGIRYTPHLFLQRINEQQEGFRKTMVYLDSRDYVRSLPTTLPYITPITHIYVNNNPIGKLPENISDMTQLRSLYVLNGNLKVLPETIGNLTQLEEIMLAGNHIKRIPDSIGNLTNLTALNLSYNDIESIPTSIANMEHLQVLDLTGNQLKEFPRVLPPNLVLLLIGGNHISPRVLQKTVVPVLQDIIF